MKQIIKARWFILALWIITTIVLTILSPDINEILRNRDQKVLPDNSPSIIADDINSRMSDAVGTNNLIVFYDKNKISNKEMNQIKSAVKSISDDSKELGVNEIIDPFSMPDAASSLISKDKTTLMVSFKLDKQGRDVSEMTNLFNAKLKNVDAEHYLSGEEFINSDYQKKAESGVEKSAQLTVLFILVVLIIMFRSVITPIISLLTVAFAYLCSMGIASQLIDHGVFPVTSLTQMLLILILFGIGTDYNILLFNRFREEMSHGRTVDEAILHTYRTAGKTIAFSILTVLIAFLSLAFAESPTYQSGIVVVIGAAVLLLDILTLTPFIMKTLGKRLFWPSKASSGHKESKIWGTVSSAATKHPIISVAVILLIIGPTIIFNQQRLNFDTIGELGDSTPSSKGFNIVAEHFGKGQAMPSTIVIESDRTLDNNTSLSVVDSLTEKIKAIDGVSKVSSITQPEGKQIKDLYISSQTKSVTKGLSSMKDGIDQMYNGFADAKNQMGGGDFSKLDEMVGGTEKLQDGILAINDGLRQLKSGINDPDSTENFVSGLTTIETNLKKMSVGVSSLADGYKQMQAGYTEMGSHYQDAANALLQMKSALIQMQDMVNSLGQSYSGAGSDKNYITLKATMDKLIESLQSITPEGIDSLNKNYNKVSNGFAVANDNLVLMGSGLDQIASGLEKMKSGMKLSAHGLGTIITNMDRIAEGLGKMKDGQKKLVDGLSGLGTFSNKLNKVTDGLKGISDGLGQTNDFLLQLTTNKTFYMPSQALTSKDFKPVLNMYLSDNKKITMMTVVLKNDPYSQAATETIDKIQETLKDGLNGTVLSDAKYGVSGPSSTTNDMNDMLSRDLNRTSIIVIIGVLLVLILVIRSFWTPVFITMSLMGAFYAAQFVINLLFINVMGYDGISSFVPFFSFIVIVALGVDYSIFLMSRFKEYPELSAKEAIILASRQIGGVVMSAVFILGGTFATLMPSGLLLLSELAIAVITGLVVLCLFMLPVFLPAMIALQEKLTTGKQRSVDIENIQEEYPKIELDLE